MSGSDPTAECYSSLISEPDADTCCKRIAVMIRRMRDDPNSLTHELHFMVLANQLFAETKTFGKYIYEINERIREDQYDMALSICDAMTQHDEMLRSIAAGKTLEHNQLVN